MKSVTSAMKVLYFYHRRWTEMRMKYRLFTIITVIFLLLACCSRVETRHAVVGSPAPAFALKDLDSKTVRLEDFNGKVAIIDFWATWCAPCKESTKELESLHRRYKDRGVVIIGISMDTGAEAVERVRKFTKEHGITYQILMDDKKMSDAYAVHAIPATFILDRNHVLVKTYPGYLPGLGSRISKDIEGLL